MPRVKKSKIALINLASLIYLMTIVSPVAAQKRAEFKSSSANVIASYNFSTPLFGLAVAPDGSLLAADAGAGVVELRKGKGNLIVQLPGVTDIAPLGRGNMYAVTGAGPGGLARRLFRVSGGNIQEVADLGAFEARVNPDGGANDSNPFDVATISGGKALVADAAGNSLLIIDQHTNIDWVATLPSELVSTANVKQILGCPPNPPPGPSPCNLPPMIPAEAVATSVAIGPDGAYYVGELKGFPAPTGESRVWRIEPGTLYAQCGVSPACTVVADGFTSIIDLAFGPDGTLYVVELDEASWFAVENGAGIGGTVNACNSSTWACAELATGLPIPTAVAVSSSGTVYATILALVPGAAKVIALP